MKYLSLFSGIGGFELGINQAYVDSINRGKKRGKQKGKTKDEETGKGLESSKGQDTGIQKGQSCKHNKHRINVWEPYCVGYSEIDKYAIQIYQKHFPEHKNYGDITKINEKELPDFDLLVGGDTPCVLGNSRRSNASVSKGSRTVGLKA